MIENQSPDSVLIRLKHLIDHWNHHEQKQCFSTFSRDHLSSDGEGAERPFSSCHLFGLGFDRWHFLLHHRTPFHLVSLFSFRQFRYVNYAIAPCPVLSLLKKDHRELESLQNILLSKSEQVPVKEVQTAQQQKLSKLQGMINAMKRGEKVTEFASQIKR